MYCTNTIPWGSKIEDHVRSSQSGGATCLILRIISLNSASFGVPTVCQYWIGFLLSRSFVWFVCICVCVSMHSCNRLGLKICPFTWICMEYLPQCHLVHSSGSQLFFLMRHRKGGVHMLGHSMVILTSFNNWWAIFP